MNKKSRKKRIFVECTCLFLVAVSLFLIAIIHYDNESVKNTYSFISTVSNVQYHSIGGAKGKYITFNADDKFYYIDCSKDEYNTIKNIATSQLPIELTVTKEKEYLRHFWLFDFEQVVEIKDGNNIYISMERHNQDQIFFRVILIVFSLVIICLDIIYALFMCLIYRKPKK